MFNRQVALLKTATLFWCFKKCLGTSLVAQRLRIYPPMQGLWVQSLVQEGPTCQGMTKPVHHSYWSPQTPEPVLRNKRSHNNEKPPHCNYRVALVHHNHRKPVCSNKDPVHQIYIYFKRNVYTCLLIGFLENHTYLDESCLFEGLSSVWKNRKVPSVIKI